ncbi:MAG: DUF2790 domain-containing protein [Pseudomonadota bacterium]
MSPKACFAACLFVALSLGALSATAQEPLKSETYTYGTPLDIQKVLALTEDAEPTCGVVNARMTYLDSAGQKRVLDYRKFSDSCLEGGN